MPAARDEMQTRVVSSDPGGVGGLLRAALPSIPVVGSLPGIRKRPLEGFEGLALARESVEITREHVDEYAAVCGFPAKDVVPLPYPHLLAFGLQLSMMGDPAFPAPAIGTVHVANAITAHRDIAVGERVAVDVHVGPPSAHPKGRTFAFVSTARVGEEVVWEETSTYLRRGEGDETASLGAQFPDVQPSGVVWRLPGDLGRRYAAVAGDYNPIHLYPLTAKALGFPRQIAHGMWSMARCVAALENRLPSHVRIDVAFKRPILLPGQVAFGSAPVHTSQGTGYAFALSDPRSGAPHLAGSSTDL